MKCYYVLGAGLCYLEKDDGKNSTFIPIVTDSGNVSRISHPNDQNRFRELISLKKALEVNTLLSEENSRKVSFKSNWRKREKFYQSKFNSLDPIQVVEIIEELKTYKIEKENKNKSLTHMEKIWLNMCEKTIKDELEVVFNERKKEPCSDSSDGKVCC